MSVRSNVDRVASIGTDGGVARPARRWAAALAASAVVGLVSGCGSQLHPNEMALANSDAAIEALEALTARYAEFGASDEAVEECRQLYGAARTANRAARFEQSQEELGRALECTRALGERMEERLAEIRTGEEVDLKVLLGRTVDWGKGPWVIVGIRPVRLGSTLRYEVKLHREASGLYKELSFDLD